MKENTQLLIVFIFIGIFCLGLLLIMNKYQENKVNDIKKCEQICFRQTISDFYKCTNACYEWERK